MSDGVSVLWVRVRGPLAEYAPGFAEVLLDRGYIEGSARLQLQLMAWVSRWLEAEGLDVGGFTELQAERYIAGRRAKGYRLFRSRRALEPLAGIWHRSVRCRRHSSSRVDRRRSCLSATAGICLWSAG